MKAVVHRGSRALETGSRVAEAPAPAMEWGGHGVHVDVIAPGCVATDNRKVLRAAPQRDQAIPDRIPAGRRGRADHLVRVAVLLASPVPEHANGIVPPVDGGWLGR